MNDWANNIKDIIVTLHAEHGGSGNCMECFECVIAGLNEAERLLIERTKERQQNGFKG